MQHRPARRTVLAALALAFASRGRAGAQPARGALKVALIPSDFAGQVYYAKDMGFFDRAGIDVEITPITNGAAIQAALTSGALDIGYSNVVAVATAHEKGVPFVFLAASNVYVPRAVGTGILVVQRAAAIRSAKDLEGKTVAVSGINELAALAVRHWVDTHGGDSTALKFVELPFPAMAEAVKAGRVDAASINKVVAPTAGRPGDPLRVLANTYDAVAPRWIPSSWIATPVWIVRHPDEAKRFVAVMKETATWANAHHRETAVILAKYLNQSPEQIELVPRAEYGTSITPPLIQPVIDLCVKYGVIKQTFPAADIIDPLAR